MQRVIWESEVKKTFQRWLLLAVLAYYAGPLHTSFCDSVMERCHICSGFWYMAVFIHSC